MKNGLKPTKRQKIAIKSAGLNYDNWLIYKVVDGKLHLVHRQTNTKRIVPA